MKNNNKKSIILTDSKIVQDEEESKEIEEALKTPFDSVMGILSKVAHYLKGNSLEKEVEWVIQIIRSKRLYSYQGLAEGTKMNNNSMEMKSLLGYLEQCSEKKNTIEENFKKWSHTTKLKPMTCTFRIHSNYFFQSRARSVVLKSEDDNNKDKEYNDYTDNLVFEHNSELDENERNSNGNDQMFLIKSNTISSKDIEEYNNLFGNGNDNEKTNNLLLSSMSFDIFNYFNLYGDKAFEYGTYGILSNFALQKYSSNEQLKSFIRAIKNNYSKEAYYHNEMHGFDVLQTIFVYISNTSIISDLELNSIDVISLIVGALVHDLGHGGYTNDFQIKTQSDLAIRYNDRNVMENYHLTKTFEVLKEKDNNILEKMVREEYKVFRKRIIEIVLSTDMLFHSKICALMKSHLDPESCKLMRPDDDHVFDYQQDVMNYLLHTADISHCSKEFEISYQWTQLIVKEFWRQGDIEKEKKLTVSFNCDRNNADIPRSQIGFMKGIILPTFEIITSFLPPLNYYKQNILSNIKHWMKLIEDTGECKEEHKNS